MSFWLNGIKQLKSYPSAVAGIILISFLLGMAVYAMVSIPYSEAVRLWRGGEEWQDHPRNASPAWTNLWRRENLPSTIDLQDITPQRNVETQEGFRRETLVYAFDYPFTTFPSEMNLFINSDFEKKNPFISISWQTPEENEIAIGNYRPGREQRFSLSQDRQLTRELGGDPAHIGLLANPSAERLEALPGEYRLVIDTIHFEEDSKLDARLILYGQVHGAAGTDHQRRDLMVAILWGTPIALLFGLAAAVGTTLTTLIIAAAGVWFGGWIDGVIQRLTEVNMILPLLPVLVMVGTLYSRSLWLMLAVVVALGIFSAGIKMYRSMLLPVKQAPFIEAARAYGAGNRRIVLRYMIPRILPVLIPGFVTLIPTFVFLEASLAVLGLGDPLLPTWGKILNDAQQQSALYNQFYYWVVTPAVMLMITGLGFAMLGFAMDRIFNPRLRTG